MKESPLWKIVSVGENSVEDLKYQWMNHPLVQQMHLPPNIMTQMLEKFDDLKDQAGLPRLKFDFSNFNVSNWWELRDLLAEVVGDWFEAELKENKIWNRFFRCWAFPEFRASYAMNDYNRMDEFDHVINGSGWSESIISILLDALAIPFSEVKGIYTFHSSEFNRFYAAAHWMFEGVGCRHRWSILKFYYLHGPVFSVVTSEDEALEGASCLDDDVVNPE